MPSARQLATIGFAALVLIAMRASAEDPRRCAIQAGGAEPAPAPFAPEVLRRRERLLERGRLCRERHPQTARYLQSILARLVRGSHLDGFAYRVPKLAFVLDCSIPLPIAMATTGKLVAVPRALPALAASEDAIAAVLGHELAHLRLQHLERRLALGATAGSGPIALLPSANRELERMQEREADRVGLDLAASAGYDPYAAIDHMRRTDALALDLRRSGRLRVRPGELVHDRLEERVRPLYERIRTCGYRPAPRRTPVDPAVKAELSGVVRSGQ